MDVNHHPKAVWCDQRTELRADAFGVLAENVSEKPNQYLLERKEVREKLYLKKPSQKGFFKRLDH